MVDTSIFNTKLYLEELAKGNGPSEIEALIFQGLELTHVGKGILRCKVLVTDRVAVNLSSSIESRFFFVFFLSCEY